MKLFAMAICLTLFVVNGMPFAIAANYQYLVVTEGVATHQGTVSVGSLRWQCTNKQCTSTGPWPTPSVTACNALAKKVGPIKSYGHSHVQLTPSQLLQCNSGLTALSKSTPSNKYVLPVPKANKIPAASNTEPQPRMSNAVPNTLPQVTPKSKAPTSIVATKPAIKPGTTAGSQPVPPIQPHGFAADANSLPGATVSADRGGFAAAASSQNTTETVRQTAALIASRANITRLNGSEGGSVCAVHGIGIFGSNFGDSPNVRKVYLLNPRDNTPISAMEVLTWGNNAITVTLPATTVAHPGGTYKVAILDKFQNPVSNVNNAISICPDHFTIRGTVQLENCNATTSKIHVTAYQDGVTPQRATIRGSATSDFAFEYEINLPAASTMNVDVRPELVGISCPGGGWTPPSAQHTLNYTHTQVTQPFNYRLGFLTKTIPLSTIISLMQGAFSGTVVRINNYDTTTHALREHDSFVKLTDALGGTEMRFEIPALLNGPRKYYINDVNLSTAYVTTVGTEFRVLLTFEDNGMEFIGTCSDDAGCIIGAPDVQASMQAEIFFTFDKYYSDVVSNTVSINHIRVVGHDNAQADGLCLALDFLCSAFNNYHVMIRRTLSTAIHSSLDTKRVRDNIGRSMQPILEGMGIGSLNSVQIDGSNLVLTYLPAR